jgi:hypothetical protein
LLTTKTLENAIGSGDERVQIADGSKRERGDVVGECPEEVALDRRERAPGKADRFSGGEQVAADEREVACLDSDVGCRFRSRARGRPVRAPARR